MFQQLLELIALGLEERGIPYMIIGGQAVLLYGEPRLTRDIDVSLGAGAERLPEVLDLVRNYGWRVLVDSPQDFVSRTMVLPCLEAASGIRVDFIFSFSPYEQQSLVRVRRVRIGKVEVRFAAVEDLIIHKIIAGRPRDLDDVRGILLKRPPLDLAYLRHWFREFDQSLGERYLEQFEEVWKTAGPK
jgi:predicted nucleotidyltransferase